MPTQLGRRRLWMALALLLCLIFIAGLAVCARLLADLPTLEDLDGHAAPPSSKVYDRYGRLLFEMPPPNTGRHSPVPLSQIPVALRQAVIATEDASYYQNPGVDAWAIVRALWINLSGREVLSGGSTITQQLARNLLLSPGERYERTLARKLREAVLAWRLSRHYAKDQILELYLNEIYFGNMAYGVEAAAQAYYGKRVCDLDLAESAMLAGLPQAPTFYNPLEDLDRAKARQAVVLDLMVKQGSISADEARRAREEKLYFASAFFPIRAPHFVMYVRGQLEDRFGLERLEQGGLQIYTTLDVELQETARDLVRYRLARLEACDGRQEDCPPGGHNVRNAALVALEPRTGEILAMLGSPDYFSARIDGAVNGTTALRQPGSSIKPITYAAAFEQGALTAASIVSDERTSFLTREGAPYIPLNYDLRYRGPVRLREALASSYNVVAVKVLDMIGVEAMTGLARRLGISSFDRANHLGLAVTLGGGEVRLLELTSAYAGLANGGLGVEPVAILRVEDEDGNTLVGDRRQRREDDAKRVLDERVAYLVTDILSDNMARIPSFGEASVLALSRPAAVKTGTTTDFRDNWTVGYTPELAVGVWTGNADNEPMRDVSGISGAAPIWHDFVESALKGQPATEFERPQGLVDVEVCAESGLLPENDCLHRVTEIFVAGTEPMRPCTMPPLISGSGLATADYETPNADEQEPRQVAEPETAVHGLVLSSPDRGAVYRLDPSLPREAQRIPVSVRLLGYEVLAEVELLVDGKSVGRFSRPPYEKLWRLQPGRHVFVAEGLDAGGKRVVSDRVWVEVKE